MEDVFVNATRLCSFLLLFSKFFNSAFTLFFLEGRNDKMGQFLGGLGCVIKVGEICKI